MDDTQLKSIIEGLLFVCGDEGLETSEIASVLEIEPDQVQHVLHEMKQEFRDACRGVQIIEIAGAFQMVTKPEHAPYFEKLADSPASTTLSQAALETLAIIAYNQPITRAEVDEIRGVKSEKAIHRLLKKSLATEVGRKEGIGRPIMYGTTEEFLDYFGLRSLEDLPALSSDISRDDVEEEANLLFSAATKNESASTDK